jgi:3-mercaptopyruvate sulfurtransferase SseA
VSRNRPVYLVCQTDNRSRIAADKFLAAGHSRVFVVSGGTLAWIAAPLPVARGDSSKEWLARNLTARNQNSTDRREASVPSGRTT